MYAAGAGRSTDHVTVRADFTSRTLMDSWAVPPAHCEGRLFDPRIVDKEWREERQGIDIRVCHCCFGSDYQTCTSSRLPVVDIEVPLYELPLPEGVGDEKLHQEQLSMREIEESWRERLHDGNSLHTQQPFASQ